MEDLMTSQARTVEERFQMIVAVHLVLVKDGQVLLARRKQTGYDDGYYGLVSGCIDGDEPSTQAMIREAKEESGITLRPDWLDCSCVMHRRAVGWEGMCLFFTANNWEGEIQNGEPHKCDDLRFFPIDALPENTIAYVRKGIEETLKGGNLFVEFGW